MTNNHLHDLLYDAQAELLNAIEKLEQYIRATGDNEAEAYIVDHLKIIASRDHGFLAGDLNLDDLLERLDDDEPEADDEAAANDDDTPLSVVHAADGRPYYWSEELARYVTIPTGD